MVDSRSNLGILIILGVYIAALLLIARYTSTSASSGKDYFLAGRRAPWWVIAIGLLGDSISGVTFISVPGMVGEHGFTYLQMVMGYFVGYVVVAYVLLPLYYRLNLTSIYGYLGVRYGQRAQRTGSAFFILSRMVGTAAKMWLIAMLLWKLCFESYGVPEWAVVAGIIVVVWLYSMRGGMKTLVWTDALQTVCVLLALLVILVVVFQRIDVPDNMLQNIRLFEFADWSSPDHFSKQFLSGILIVVVMTGLDQNIMQKNLAHKDLRRAQRGMLWYGFGFLPMNALFLVLGALLYSYAAHLGLVATGDQLLPALAGGGYLGQLALIAFAVGIVAATFSNIDTVITSITTSISTDLLRRDANIKVIHALVCISMFILILLFAAHSHSNALQVVLKAASYTYGPLLGLYAFGIFTRYGTHDKAVPYIALAAPVLCYIIEVALQNSGYTMGYEVLILNGMLTFAMLIISRRT